VHADGTLFHATGVEKRYGGLVAVAGVELSVARGEIVGIIGPNGAGKTTFVDVCTAVAPRDGGRLELDGRNVSGLGAAQLAEAGVGRTFQDARLWPSLTVSEAVATALERHVEVRDPLLCSIHSWSVVASESSVRERVDEVLASTGLEPYRDTFVSELSTGTRRILEIACALAHGPRLLFMDEPTAGVAQRESEALGGLLTELRDREGMTLVVVEHNIPVVSSISDRLVCMDVGGVIAEGSPAAVLADDAVVASYLGNGLKSAHRRGDNVRRKPRKEGTRERRRIRPGPPRSRR
jgi:branched-chain amino acid transport system ATP-binding protein